MSNKITKHKVADIAKLTNMSLEPQELEELTKAFVKTLEVINQLQELEVSKVDPTHHVTGIKNVTREDVVEENYSYTQQQALANTNHSHQGFFVVPRVLEKDV